jgi:hypothetical protein
MVLLLADGRRLRGLTRQPAAPKILIWTLPRHGVTMDAVAPVVVLMYAPKLSLLR